MPTLTTHTLDVPGEPGQTVTIRRVGWTALRDARRAQAQPFFDLVREKGADVALAEAKRLIEQHGGITGLEKLAAADPALGYDAATLIRRSVSSWQPPRALPSPGSELETWLAREILKLSSPGLFKADNAGV